VRPLALFLQIVDDFPRIVSLANWGPSDWYRRFVPSHPRRERRCLQLFGFRPHVDHDASARPLRTILCDPSILKPPPLRVSGQRFESVSYYPDHPSPSCFRLACTCSAVSSSRRRSLGEVYNCRSSPGFGGSHSSTTNRRRGVVKLLAVTRTSIRPMSHFARQKSISMWPSAGEARRLSHNRDSLVPTELGGGMRGDGWPGPCVVVRSNRARERSSGLRRGRGNDPRPASSKRPGVTKAKSGGVLMEDGRHSQLRGQRPKSRPRIDFRTLVVMYPNVLQTGL